MAKSSYVRELWRTGELHTYTRKQTWSKASLLCALCIKKFTLIAGPVGFVSLLKSLQELDVDELCYPEVPI